MRISCDENDLAYFAPIHTELMKVYLDDELVKGCMTADEEEGTVTVYAIAKGEIGDNRVLESSDKWTVLKGKVRIDAPAHCRDQWETTMRVGLTKQVIANHFLDMIQQCSDIDPASMHNLMCMASCTTEEMEEHPNFMVRGPEGIPMLGMLGVINGIMDKLTGLCLAYSCEDKPKEGEKPEYRNGLARWKWMIFDPATQKCRLRA